MTELDDNGAERAETQSTSRPGTLLPDPASIGLDRDALFLDFDGTLAPIALRPDLVVLPPETKALVSSLSRRFGGAVAIITGRKMSEIDRHLAPLEMPMSALYGLAYRFPGGEIENAPASDETVGRIVAMLEPFVARHDGLVLERKGHSVALHYRARPDLEAACHAVAKTFVDDDPSMKLMHGKMVVELTPVNANKGIAIQRFLKQQPFVGRRPIYIGDDVADEAAFAAVQAYKGIAIKIGTEPTNARYRALDMAASLAWLRALPMPPATGA